MNTLSGFAISVVAGLYLYPMFGYEIPLAQVTWLTLIFTVISIVRSYVWRRLYNWLDHHGGREQLTNTLARFLAFLNEQFFWRH